MVLSRTVVGCNEPERKSLSESNDKSCLSIECRGRDRVIFINVSLLHEHSKGLYFNSNF